MSSEAQVLPLDEGDSMERALGLAISALYKDDQTEYEEALWDVVRALNPSAAEMLEEDKETAYRHYVEYTMSEQLHDLEEY